MKACHSNYSLCLRSGYIIVDSGGIGLAVDCNYSVGSLRGSGGLQELFEDRILSLLATARFPV